MWWEKRGERHTRTHTHTHIHTHTLTHSHTEGEGEEREREREWKLLKRVFSSCQSQRRFSVCRRQRLHPSRISTGAEDQMWSTPPPSQPIPLLSWDLLYLFCMDENSTTAYGFLTHQLMWLEPRTVGGIKTKKTTDRRRLRGGEHSKWFPAGFPCLWEQHLSLPWTWDRASAEREPVPEEEHRPEAGKARVRECFFFYLFFFFFFLRPERGSCGFYAPERCTPTAASSCSSSTEPRVW